MHSSSRENTATLDRPNGQKVPIVMYHSIANDAKPRFKQFAVPPRVFASHMAFLDDQGYTPLTINGAKSEHVIAYLRGQAVATVVPRLTTKVMDAWRDTAVVLPEGTWTNRLTGAAMGGGAVSMRNLLREFPVALLVREDSAHA